MTTELRYCKNCGIELHGEYCSACGQRDKDLYIPVKELAGEFIEVIPSFDQRMFRTFRSLLLEPGRLTAEYLSGKRKKYLSPFKFYLFISFLFFFVDSLSLSESKKELRSEFANMDSSITVINGDSSAVSLRSRRSNVVFTIADTAKVEKLFGRRFLEGFRSTRNDPEEFFNKVKEHLPKIVFLLLPVFALLLKLVYIRLKILYIRHLVFSFYFHSFIFFILLIDTLFEMVMPKGTHLYGNIIMLSIPVYLYAGLKNAYHQSAWKTGIKFLLLSLSHAIIFFLSLTLFVVVTVLLFFS
ncbi:MAG: DUF3667 domain-containing protein [Bacteroidota bacterium]